MSILDGIKNALRKGGNSVKEAISGNSHVTQIWDLDGVPSFRQFWQDGIFPWKYIYKGYYEPWHNIPDPTIANSKRIRKIDRLNAGKFISQTMARYIWGEQCAITVTRTGSKDGADDVLNLFIANVLEANNFYVKLAGTYEYGAALGGGCIKTWCEIKPSTEAEAEPEKRIQLSYHMADQFIPTDWTNADVTGGFFVSREARKGYYYTRIEKHGFLGDVYVITNRLFRERTEEVNRLKSVENVEPQTILGWECPLDTLYPMVTPYAEIKDLDRSLFAYFKPSGANNLDDNSPLGISIYANAMDTLHAIDTAFDGFVHEIIMSRKRIIVPIRATTPKVDEYGNARRYFDPNDAVFEALNFDNAEELKIQEMQSELRVDAYVSAINALLSILCVQIGWDPGTLTFDKATGLKTATEVISENSKTYTTIKTHQTILKAAIEKTIHNIINVAVLYGIEYQGQTVAAMMQNGYEISVHFDDSIIQDRQTDINEGVLLTGAGLLSKRRFMTKTLGYTDEEADKELQDIAAERKIDAPDLDNLGLQFGEGGAGAE